VLSEVEQGRQELKEGRGIPHEQVALNEAVEFAARDSISGALRVLEQALAAAESLATLSERGRVVPELSQMDTREIFFCRYCPLYDVEPEVVRIVAFRLRTQSVPGHHVGPQHENPGGGR